MSKAVYREKKAQRVDAIFKRIQQGVREIQKLINPDPQYTMNDSHIENTVNQYRRTNYAFMIRHDPDIIALLIMFRFLINSAPNVYGGYIINRVYVNAQALYMSNPSIRDRLDTYFLGQPQTDSISRTRLFVTLRAYEIAIIAESSSLSS